MVNGFGVMIFRRDNDRDAENYFSGQIAASKEKQILGLFGWDSSPELNTKKVGNSPSFPSITYSALSN
jgi:hypothetical protein